MFLGVTLQINLSNVKNEVLFNLFQASGQMQW